MVDLSDLVILHSYVEDCIEEYDSVKQFNVSKHFRYLAEEIEDLINKEQGGFPKD